MHMTRGFRYQWAGRYETPACQTIRHDDLDTLDSLSFHLAMTDDQGIVVLSTSLGTCTWK
jgi:hypothetical protein